MKNLTFYSLFALVSISTLNATNNHRIMLPDSINEDTTDYQIGDTIAIYTSGWDTSYITYDEVIDSMENMWVVTVLDKMIIELKHQHAPVNEGVIGVNLSDFFEPGHGNLDDDDEYLSNPDPSVALIEMAPKTIRIFSGAGSKFMHPLGYLVDDPLDLDPDDDMMYGGYGYSWKEIVPFYDITAIGAADLGDIETDMGDDECNFCGDWMDDDRFEADFEDFYFKWATQTPFNPTDPAYDTNEERPLYLNQFLELVSEIESLNEYTVDVIYCINILTEPASVVRETIDYMRHNSIHNVNVVGVEIGNEVYFDFQRESLNFIDFRYYWEYINGVEDYSDVFPLEDFELADVLPANMINDHDYIGALKGPDPDIFEPLLIGLPAQNIPNCGADWDFPLGPPMHEDRFTGVPMWTDPGGSPCDCEYPEWNTVMTEYYDETILPEGQSFPSYKFDAVIFHNYYTPRNNNVDCLENSNWQDILVSLNPAYTTSMPPSYSITDFEYGETPPDDDTPWDYTDPIDGDSRLQQAFYGITGRHYPTATDPLIPGNYKEFVRDRIDITFMEHANQMYFTNADTDPENKEVWMTEFNLHDGLDIPKYEVPDPDLDVSAILQPYASFATNTFAHAVLLQNWFLWNLKSSFDNDYRTYFFTRATTQNFISGSSIGLLGKSNFVDQILTGEVIETDVLPDGLCDETNPAYIHQIRKPTYFAQMLWRVIIDNNLEYLKSTSALAVSNDNLPPTVFINESAQDLYVFYSNVTGETHQYCFDPGTLSQIYCTSGSVNLAAETVTGLILDADELYSTSGRSSLFEKNSMYDVSCSSEILIPNRFEIDQLSVITPSMSCPTAFASALTGEVCVTVPPISMGYFKIGFTISCREGEMVNNFTIYPNPANNYFIIQPNTADVPTFEQLKVKIYNMFISLVSETSTSSGEKIDISNLPVGAYKLLIDCDSFESESESLIKMK